MPLHETAVHLGTLSPRIENWAVLQKPRIIPRQLDGWLENTATSRKLSLPDLYNPANPLEMNHAEFNAGTYLVHTFRHSDGELILSPKAGASFMGRSALRLVASVEFWGTATDKEAC